MLSSIIPNIGLVSLLPSSYNVPFMSCNPYVPYEYLEHPYEQPRTEKTSKTPTINKPMSLKTTYPIGEIYFHTQYKNSIRIKMTSSAFPFVNIGGGMILTSGMFLHNLSRFIEPMLTSPNHASDQLIPYLKINARGSLSSSVNEISSIPEIRYTESLDYAILCLRTNGKNVPFSISNQRIRPNQTVQLVSRESQKSKIAARIQENGKLYIHDCHKISSSTFFAIHSKTSKIVGMVKKSGEEFVFTSSRDIIKSSSLLSGLFGTHKAPKTKQHEQSESHLNPQNMKSR